MLSSNCCFLTCIQISQEAVKVVWYSHLFKNFLKMGLCCKRPPYLLKLFSDILRNIYGLRKESQSFMKQWWSHYFYSRRLWDGIPLGLLGTTWLWGRSLVGGCWLAHLLNRNEAVDLPMYQNPWWDHVCRALSVLWHVPKASWLLPGVDPGLVGPEV